MNVLPSLRNRVFLASALVAIASVAVATQFVTARVTREAEAELRRGLSASADLIERHHAARLESLASMARLVADLPKLKAAVATGDPPTVGPVAKDYRERVGCDVLIVTGAGGRPLAALGARSDTAAIAEALAGSEAITFQEDGSRLLEIVTVPIAIGLTPPEVLGTLSLGFALDDALARQFRELSQSEIAFVEGGRVRAATLADRAPLPALARAAGITTLRLEGAEYVALARPLTAGGPMAVVLRSRTERLQFLGTFRTGLWLAALVAVLVAVVGSYAVARTITRPLAAITAAMDEMAATGDLTRKVRLPRPWHDHDASLLATTFNTLTDSIARFQREAALRERLSALGRLSTVVAHEIRNPLMILKAAAHTLRREGVGTAEVREAAVDIDEEVQRLNRIVDDVLDFARPLHLDYAACDLNQLCRDAAQAALSGVSAPSHRLLLDDQLPPIVTDGERLRTALVNIVSNARDAVQGRDSGVGDALIELRTESAPMGRIGIVVADHGLGIAAADLPHVLDPYFTTKRTGTGLGLAIARNVVEALGGTLTVESRPGQGTSVRLELPAQPGTA
jgi:signal transduction histidine kinase